MKTIEELQKEIFQNEIKAQKRQAEMQELDKKRQAEMQELDKKRQSEAQKRQAEMQELDKKRQAEMQKLDEKAKKSTAEMKKAIKEMSQELGGLGKSQGLVCEEFFANSLSDNMKLGNIDYDYMLPNLRKKDKKLKIEGEFDIVLVNGSDVAIIEAKYRAREKDLERLLDKKISNFKKLFSEYKNYTHDL